MNMRALALGLLLAASPAFAAEVDGKWTGSVDTPNGPLPVTFDFKADGNKLSGGLLGPDGTPIPIKDGKVDGHNISFTLEITMGGADPLSFNYTGMLAGKELKLHTDYMGTPVDYTVKKAD
jgi:hypothetical protein